VKDRRYLPGKEGKKININLRKTGLRGGGTRGSEKREDYGLKY